MESLPAGHLLEMLERGRHASPVRRGLLLLQAASPGVPPEELEALPPGRRDARLLELRRTLFGEVLEGVVECGACGERLELRFRVADVLAPVPEPWPGEGWVGRDGVRVRFRLPHSGDLLALEAAGAGAGGRHLLLERCVLAATREGDGGPVAAGDLPDSLASALADAMEEADPQGAVRLATDCPACGQGWSVPFDIVAWLWEELEGWGRGVLQEVHLLARAYGWSESEILALGVSRRRSYLELATR